MVYVKDLHLRSGGKQTFCSVGPHSVYKRWGGPAPFAARRTAARLRHGDGFVGCASASASVPSSRGCSRKLARHVNLPPDLFRSTGLYSSAIAITCKGASPRTFGWVFRPFGDDPWREQKAR